MTLTQHEKIAYQFASEREKAGKTQAEVAKYLGVTYQAISNWERGQTKIDSVSLLRALQFFGVDIYAFFENCGFDVMQTADDDSVPLHAKKAPSVSDEGMKVAVAFDKADEDHKDIVRTALSKYLAAPAQKGGSAKLA